jgi:imidazolonepropionase-like amidohydrolase
MLSSSASYAETLLIRGATVIDGTGREPIPDAVMVVEDGRFSFVGTRDEAPIPHTAREIEARGLFAIPGLMDANIHLMLNTDPVSLVRFEGRYHEIVLEGAQLALKSGQTTVFDTWGPLPDLVKVRDDISSGDNVGARIFLAGNIIGMDGPFSADIDPNAGKTLSKRFVNRVNQRWAQNVGREMMDMTPEEVRQRIREYAASGVDFLKYNSAAHTMDTFIAFSQRVQNAITDEGHRLGKTVQAHVGSTESLNMAIEAGVDIATHCDVSGMKRPLSHEIIEKLASSGVACSILPITQRRLKALQDGGGANAILAAFALQADKNLDMLIEAGAKLLLSTDAGVSDPEIWKEYDITLVDPRRAIGEGHFNGLVALEEKGMNPMQILQSATSNIAEAYGLEAELGTLEPGKLADVVLLGSNPLLNAQNYRDIQMIFKEGQLIDPEVLPETPIISVDSDANSL